MKHFLLKFNHGVEIGARSAYLGHWIRTNDPMVFEIANEELEHRTTLRFMLLELGHKPSPAIDWVFRRIGNVIYRACAWAPIWSLDLVARSMEIFAVFNYTRLARMYPKYSSSLRRMALAEDRHRRYFA